MSVPMDKKRYVNAMFARIAGRYDRMNRLMSLGRDRAWRRRVIQLAAVPPGGRLLDVATGTGDLLLAALEQDPTMQIAGLDFTLEMLRVGQAKLATARSTDLSNLSVGWVNADGLGMPYPHNSFDAVISAFMLRNVTDIPTALAEQRRVVRPGGRVVCLELTHPTLPIWRQFYRFLFSQVMPLFTGLLSGQPSAYRYLPASLNSFVTAKELQEIMAQVGLQDVDYQTMMLDTVAIHTGTK